MCKLDIMKQLWSPLEEQWLLIIQPQPNCVYHGHSVAHEQTARPPHWTPWPCPSLLSLLSHQTHNKHTVSYLTKCAPGEKPYIWLRSSWDVDKCVQGNWCSDSWYYSHCPGMSLLFRAAPPCWVSQPMSRLIKDQHATQRFSKGYHDGGFTIGVVSAFSFSSV